MTPEELRLECLKLVLQSANASGILVASGEIISRAHAYADFVMDRSGHGSIAKANGAQNLELALEEGFQVPAPSVSFEPSVFAGAAYADQANPSPGGKMNSARRH